MLRLNRLPLISRLNPPLLIHKHRFFLSLCRFGFSIPRESIHSNPQFLFGNKKSTNNRQSSVCFSVARSKEPLMSLIVAQM
ncbi:hypothetical protein Hanom_Chr02g00144101 [Helianthus anomalus]